MFKQGSVIHLMGLALNDKSSLKYFKIERERLFFLLLPLHLDDAKAFLSSTEARCI